MVSDFTVNLIFFLFCSFCLESVQTEDYGYIESQMLKGMLNILTTELPENTKAMIMLFNRLSKVFEDHETILRHLSESIARIQLVLQVLDELTKPDGVVAKTNSMNEWSLHTTFKSVATSQGVVNRDDTTSITPSLNVAKDGATWKFWGAGNSKRKQLLGEFVYNLRQQFFLWTAFMVCSCILCLKLYFLFNNV